MCRKGEESKDAGNLVLNAGERRAVLSIIRYRVAGGGAIGNFAHSLAIAEWTGCVCR